MRASVEYDHVAVLLAETGDRQQRRVTADAILAEQQETP